MDLKEMKQKTAEIMSQASDVYDKDAVLAEMFSAGIPFGKLQSLYKSVGVSEGLIADPAEIKENVENAVEESEITEFDEYSELEELASSIANDVDGATETQVVRAIKAYCRENEIDVPKKTKAKSPGSRAAGGKIVEAVVNFAAKNKPENITRRGLYDAVLPVVKGPKNAYDNVNTYFGVVYAVKNNLSFEVAADQLKSMEGLNLESLEREFDEASA